MLTPLADSIEDAQTRWDAAVVLLRAWNQRPAAVAPVRDDEGFLQLVDQVRAHFDAHPDSLELTDRDRRFIVEMSANGRDPHRIDAVGFGLNFAASAGFAESWRERAGANACRPAAGDVYPAADAPWPRELGASRRTPSPRSMSIDGNDHPFARTYRDGMLPVEFDFTLWRPLLKIGLNLDLVAAVSVNETPAELGLEGPRPVAFPVTPRDPDRQAALVAERLQVAMAAGAQVVVFPELSTSAAIADRIERVLADDDGERLVVCGSWHAKEAGEPANLSVGLVSGRRSAMRHRKMLEFGDLYPKKPDDRRREGIVPPDPRLLRIHVAGPFRFALTICKDFLGKDVTHTLDRVGAHVLLVPALTRTMQPFKARAGAHVADAQAVSLVANGPRTWNRSAGSPTAFLARPYEPNELIEATAEPAPSTIVFSLRDATAR